VATASVLGGDQAGAKGSSGGWGVFGELCFIAGSFQKDVSGISMPGAGANRARCHTNKEQKRFLQGPAARPEGSCAKGRAGWDGAQVTGDASTQKDYL